MAVPAISNGGRASSSSSSVLPTTKRRTARLRRRRKGPGQQRGAIALAICLFASFWGIVVMYLYSSVGGTQRGGGSRGGGTKRNGSNAAASSAAGGAAANDPAAAAARVRPVPASGDDTAEARALALRPESPNPHEGWQPVIDDDSGKCSWRDCFKASTTDCALCRNLESQTGPAPPAPDGWIPDVTVLRRMYLGGKDGDGNPWPPALPDVLCEDVSFNGGKTGDINKKCLDAIPVVGEPLGKSETQARAEGLSNGKEIPEGTAMPRLMCLVYTMASEHSTRIRAIRETWAGGCDGFLAFSTESDPRIPAISLPHDGPEEYHNMWQKVRSIWRFVGTHYINDFEYFFIGGDDLFVMPQNLREYLWTLGSAEDDHFVGRRFKSNVYFNSGGAGYALSRGTLRKFVEHIDDKHGCSAAAHTSMEDVMIAQCLTSLGIDFTDTRDSRGRERFHPFAPGSHLTWNYPKDGNRDWYEEYNKEWGLKLGEECCAPDSVSWHYMKKPAMVRHIYSLLYLCGGQDKDGGGLGNLRKRNNAP